MVKGRTTGKAKLMNAAAKGVMKALDNVLREGKKLGDDALAAAKKAQTRRVPAAAKRRRSIPPHIKQRLDEGNAFNRKREPYYRARGGGNEITLSNKTRVDSYVPNKEIVSRKHTDLSSIKEDTAKGYLRELDSKYKSDANVTILDTKHNRDQIGDVVGGPMRGKPILEVPVQSGGVPQSVLDEAKRLGITIRDETGKVYR
ncbi:hypothetical protein [Allorhizocola rhizosphaerae]|uniref:hypothetical protein n=1 Tax=Allorhizocola rhizosphaerae TaxID=1872709 RepID=UPI000E3E557A|nr:hypothetical protein [Allorhizocola rhizosphaerae]